MMNKSKVETLWPHIEKPVITYSSDPSLSGVKVSEVIFSKINRLRVEDGEYPTEIILGNAASARIGIWYRFNNVLSKRCYVDLGVDHHSQWSEGAPFNDRGEYIKQEWFLDATCTLGGLL